MYQNSRCRIQENVWPLDRQVFRFNWDDFARKCGFSKAVLTSKTSLLLTAMPSTRIESANHRKRVSHVQMTLRLQCLAQLSRRAAHHSQRCFRRHYHLLKRQTMQQPLYLMPWSQRRSYGTGFGLIPRGFIFRAFWTAVTATLGFIYYQVHQASSWMNDKAELLREWGLLSLIGAVDTWQNIAASTGGFLSWNPFRWGQRTLKGIKDPFSQSQCSLTLVY